MFRLSFRINTRVSQRVNEWLDNKSAEMAVSKSALVAFAIENYINQVEAVQTVQTLPVLLDELEKQGIKLDSIK